MQTTRKSTDIRISLTHFSMLTMPSMNLLSRNPTSYLTKGFLTRKQWIESFSCGVTIEKGNYFRGITFTFSRVLYDSFYPPFHLPFFPTIVNFFHYTCLSGGIVPGIAGKTVEQETRVHTGVKSGLPIDSSQPLVDSPPPWLTKAPLYEWNDSTPNGVSRETFTKATHPSSIFRFLFHDVVARSPSTPFVAAFSTIHNAAYTLTKSVLECVPCGYRKY